jgi:hypothetical protein
MCSYAEKLVACVLRHSWTSAVRSTRLLSILRSSRRVVLVVSSLRLDAAVRTSGLGGSSLDDDVISRRRTAYDDDFIQRMCHVTPVASTVCLTRRGATHRNGGRVAVRGGTEVPLFVAIIPHRMSFSSITPQRKSRCDLFRACAS